MKTTIFYYSATGNSLRLAREIASGIGGAELLPLAKYRKEGIRPDAERIGIVFPILAWGPPRSVDEFVERLDASGLRYVFAVASCGGTAGGTLQKLRSSLRKKGSDLHAGFIVRSPSYMDDSGGGKQARMIEFVRRASGKPFPTEAERLPAIVETVAACVKVRPDRHAALGRVMGDFFHAKAAESFSSMDAAYKVAPSCTGCGICAKVCPRENIAFDGKLPNWRRDCEFCGACSTWCPAGAIGFTGMPASPKRHNPSVAARDFYLN